jgi:hypothetical protein
MACGGTEGRGESKFSYACRLAGALCFVGLVRLETIVIQPFGERLAESYRAQGGRHRFAVASDFISGLSTGGRSDFRNSIRQFLSAAPASGLAVILSDFLDPDCTTSLQHLADHGQELLLVQVAGPEDRTPPWEGELELLDAESGELLRVHMDQHSAAEYTASYDEFCRSIEYAAMRNGGRYMHLSTEVAVQDALFGSLMRSGAVSLQ